MSLLPKNVDFVEVWEGIAVGIERILRLEAGKGMTLVEDVYALCTAQPRPYSEELYVKGRQQFKKHGQSTLAELQSLSDENLFRTYMQRWSAYSLGSQYVNRIFRYLNNNFIQARLRAVQEEQDMQSDTSSTSFWDTVCDLQ